MFVNLSSGQRGLVCLWDVVAFDEAADIRFPDRNRINIMKGYMEDGAFSRGRDIITAEGSVVFVGNLDGAVETIVRTPHLFYPMPKEMDTAFYDHIHAYIPG
jgi:ATP-dependent Lon protease